MKRMTYSGWGNFPALSPEGTNIVSAETTAQLQTLIHNHKPLIAQGNRRSYGDSALGKNILINRHNKHFLAFHEKTGVLHCQSGVLLADIIETFLPRGWFPAITPGTKFVTIAGAIASDVHGKNHHHRGAFSECVIEFDLMLASGEIICCSRTQNIELFYATCGGMGLTGIILTSKIQLQAVNSQNIEQKKVKTRSLHETFEQFEKNRNTNYSVAWIDCLASGWQLGRSIMTFGEHAQDGDLNYQSGKKASLPFYLPTFCLNPMSLKIANTFLYQKVLHKESHQKVSIDSFFYPLDAILHWNRLYGKSGFLQYQFVLPLDTSFAGMSAILAEIARSGSGSFLAVLKLLGKQNDNYLSFPMSGYTLALDFKNQPATHHLFDRLDKIVCQYNGRFYLAKDARISRSAFEQGYPDINTFRRIRKQYQLDETFASLQSQRLAL